jgi:hypothetical protein
MEKEIDGCKINISEVEKVTATTTMTAKPPLQPRLNCPATASSPTSHTYLYPVYRVTENNTLIDLQLCEQRVKAVNFLLFLNECVVLRDASQGQFVHQIDDVGV